MWNIDMIHKFGTLK